MAYAHDADDAAAQQQPKNDIFGNIAGAMDSGGQAEPGQLPGVQRTTTETGVGSSAGSSAGGESAPAPQQPAGQASASSLSQKNLGKAQAPRAVGQAQDELKTAQEGFQKEADAYTQSAKNTNYNVDTPTIDQAISGNKDASGKILSTMHQVVAPEAFAPQTDTSLKTSYALSSPAGVKNALQQEGGQHMTSGMARFDAGLLGQNKDFNNTLSSLQKGRSDFLTDVDKQTKDRATEAQKIKEANLASAQKDIVGQLGSKKQIIDEQANMKRDLAKQQYDKLVAQGVPPNMADEMIQRIKSEQAPLEQAGGANWSTKLSTNGLDLSKYGEVSPYDANAADYFDPDQANQWNNIEGLLGGTGSRIAGAAPKAPQWSYKQGGEQALQQELKDRAISADRTADDKALAAIKDRSADIQKSAAARLDPYNQSEAAKELARIRSLYQATPGVAGAGTPVQGQQEDPQYIRQRTEGWQKPALYGDVYGDLDPTELGTPVDLSSLDPSQFYSKNWRSAVTADEANSLSPYNQELGGALNSKIAPKDQIQAGSGASGFDREAYGNALVAMLQKQAQDSRDQIAREKSRKKNANFVSQLFG